ncbi:hypothetical protein VTO42DRAFT_5199 [Malbranchea cinnamomea]
MPAPAPPPTLSAASRALLERVRKIVPPMLEHFHKGQLGRVAVIGGSADYTGAPYFSAMASARLGCDMSHVICEPSASTVIKSYSPNLMVHPLLKSSQSINTSHPFNPREHAEPIIAMLKRLHALVIGPGLGRDSITQKIVMEIIKEARSRSIPMVLDADALLLVQENPDLVSGYEECILTPNVVEFARLAKAMGVDISPREGAKSSEKERLMGESEVCERLSRALGGVLIIQKGPQDVISNGVTSLISDVQGGKKRSGGQGDTLTGSLGTLLAWRAAYHEGLWDTGEETGHPAAESREDVDAQLHGAGNLKNQKMSPKTTILLVAWAGSAITRECSRRAFLAYGRAMQASDLTEEVHPSFLALIGEPEASKL